MNTKTLEQLDYFRIREIVAGCAMTVEGRALLLERLPFTDLETIAQLKKEASEWLAYLAGARQPALTGFDAVRPFFDRIGVDGATLELAEVYELGRFCRAVMQTKKALASSTEKENAERSKVFGFLNLSALNEWSEKLPQLDEAESAIFRIIDDSGEMKDLPEIRAVRNSIQKLHREIENLMRSYTSDNQLRDVLQSDLPTLRSDRQVLAVKANFRGRIKGIVHEMSQTGQTVYIEPDDVVQRNNDLVQEEFRLQQEIRKVLKQLTEKLKIYKPDFEYAHTIMMRLDCAYACAKWAQEINGTFAWNISAEKSDNTSDVLTLVKARHPLLGAKAVPIDVKFQPGCRVLIITGPNTGGKTVTLKTIALFALLNQSGFPVPAAEGTALPIFDSVFADIGDEQSLDQSLSTFSGHMKNIADALNGATENSLVLLDELGSGTDPQEGGAIAMATLDELLNRNSFVLVTTHHGILKNYGYTHPTCLNASVEFDENTLSPTYRILMGVPGESHALDIAIRSGLPSSVEKQARSYLLNEQADVSALIKGLNAKHEELARLEKEAIKKEQHISEKWRKVDLKDLKLRQKELELREQGYMQSKRFIDDNRKMLENLVRELKEGEINRDKTLKVKETIARLSEAVEAEGRILKTEEQNFAMLVNPKNDGGSAESGDIVPGIDVLVGTAKRRGTVISLAKKGSWNVQFGSVKMVVKEKDMAVVPVSSNVATPSISIEMVNEPDNRINGKKDSRVSFTGGISGKPVFELRLLGMRYEDAMKALERQLDLCAINNVKSFSVIHGKGTGVLQQGVQNLLSHYPGVSDFKFARPEDGGTGKTYVEL